jgi:hypothetical protein
MTDRGAPPAELAATLVHARGLAVEFGDTLANHLPMVLWAQWRLGGDTADARRFTAAYVAANGCTEPAVSPGPVARAHWRDHVGDRRFEAAYRRFFLGELERLGETGLLRTYLPALVPGVAASALHALMRLAYARDAEAPTETATALAYWATTYLPLGEGAGAPARTPEPAGVLARMAEEPALREVTCPTPLLWHFMRRIAEERAFRPVYDWLDTEGDVVGRMARDALRLYAATLDFSALHAVTGTHWLRLVAPSLDDPQPLIRSFWQAISALYPKMGFPVPLDAATAEAAARLPCPGWGEIAAAAVASNDEHHLSFTYSAREEQAVHGGRLYQVAAAACLGLIPPPCEALSRTS